MNNYQLYRTNIKLGGQMKYDLILKSGGQNLLVEDFYITPISKLIHNYEYRDINILNYTHQENISRFYKKIQGSFYQIPEDQYMTHQYPIANNINTDIYNSTYEMGCRRAKYGDYNKQFEFFCPIWLEQIKEDEYLNFQFSVYSSTDTLLCTKNLILNPFTTDVFHNKFVKYIQSYFEYIKLNEGNDKIFYIEPLYKKATVTGMNVSSGEISTKQIFGLLDNLLNREIPLMESDGIIINNIADKKLIVNQLFNFNLCFNIEDLIPKHLLKMIMGQKLKISVNVGIGDQKLPIKDFYSNYDYIEKDFCGPYQIQLHRKNGIYGIYDKTNDYINEMGLGSKINVLDYLKDYQYISYMDKNKITQSIIHWSLNDSNDYIFNIYNGFSGFNIIEDANSDSPYTTKTFLPLSNKYGKTPNLKNIQYSNSQNSLNWCNMIQIMDNSILFHSEHLLHILKYCSTFSHNSWVNGIRYKYPSSEQVTKIKVLLISLPNQTNTSWLMNLNEYNPIIYPVENENTKWVFIKNNGEDYLLIFLPKKIKYEFTYKKVIGYLSNLLNTNELDETKINLINFLKNILSNNLTDPLYQFIILPNILEIQKADSPSLSSTEIDYYKNSKNSTHLERYFGHIKPTFIDENDNKFNYVYKKKILDENESDLIKKYHDSGFPPIYPSIDYYFLQKTEELYNIQNINIETGGEYHKFNYNLIYILYPNLEFTYTTQQDLPNTVEDMVDQFLKDKYKQNDINTQYIKSLYEIDYTTDYVSEYNINDYIYRIKLTLK